MANIERDDNVPEMIWEQCEIQFEQVLGGCWGFILNAVFSRYTYVFKADAVGPIGKYVALESLAFTGPGNIADGGNRTDEANRCLDSLVEILTDYRKWEPQPQGRYWYNLRFRRLVPRIASTIDIPANSPIAKLQTDTATTKAAAYRIFKTYQAYPSDVIDQWERVLERAHPVFPDFTSVEDFRKDIQNCKNDKERRFVNLKCLYWLQDGWERGV